jgi:hypothetical protein
MRKKAKQRLANVAILTAATAGALAAGAGGARKYYVKKLEDHRQVSNRQISKLQTRADRAEHHLRNADKTMQKMVDEYDRKIGKYNALKQRMKQSSTTPSPPDTSRPVLPPPPPPPPPPPISVLPLMPAGTRLVAPTLNSSVLNDIAKGNFKLKTRTRQTLDANSNRPPNFIEELKRGRPALKSTRNRQTLDTNTDNTTKLIEELTRGRTLLKTRKVEPRTVPREERDLKAALEKAFDGRFANARARSRSRSKSGTSEWDD